MHLTFKYVDCSINIKPLAMSKFYQKLIKPAMFRLDAELAHEIGMHALRLGFAGAFAGLDRNTEGSGASLEVERFGLKFKNPLGVAAGFDKNGIVVDRLSALGFGFVEVGTVTLRPQKGNDKPRLFRLPEDEALINRLGFNNDGAEAVAERLRKLDRKCVVGVNIGKNKDVPNEEAVENYLACFDLVYDVADYIAVNISSPNTPNLRELQRGDNLEALVRGLRERVVGRGRIEQNTDANADRKTKPLLVKIAPDLSEAEIEEIVGICTRHDVDGIIATNTTVSRDGLTTPDIERFGAGGLSGRPVACRANDVIRAIYKYSNGKMPVVGVGGIFSADDAFQKIAAGASLLEAYTGFVYAGPSFAHEITSGLASLLEYRGFATIEAAVGSDSRS
jgi:dihydroorotate dehydrogenase